MLYPLELRALNNLRALWVLDRRFPGMALARLQIIPGYASGSRTRQNAYWAAFSVAFTAMTSISTNAQGAASAATCMALRAGLFGCSLVPKKRV
jgi:hypothetical protein